MELINLALLEGETQQDPKSLLHNDPSHYLVQTPSAPFFWQMELQLQLYILPPGRPGNIIPTHLHTSHQRMQELPQPTYNTSPQPNPGCSSAEYQNFGGGKNSIASSLLCFGAKNPQMHSASKAGGRQGLPGLTPGSGTQAILCLGIASQKSRGSATLQWCQKDSPSLKSSNALRQQGLHSPKPRDTSKYLAGAIFTGEDWFCQGSGSFSSRT